MQAIDSQYLGDLVDGYLADQSSRSLSVDAAKAVGQFLAVKTALLARGSVSGASLDVVAATLTAALISSKG